MYSFLNLNGKILPADAPYFTSTNRSLRYGDGLFEGMRMMNGEILFFEDHLQRMFNALTVLGFTIPANFTSAFFYKQITDLLVANKVSSDVLIRIQVYRAGAGLYGPETDEPEFFIELLQAPVDGFQWYEKGISVGVFEDWKKELNPAMHFKTSNSLVYVMAARMKKEMGWDDVIILNAKNVVCDATSSNVFIWKDERLITPILQDGPVKGMTRKNLLEFAFMNQVKIEERSMVVEELTEADELFLTNISRGIRWVERLGEKTYKNERTKQLAEGFYTFLRKRV